MATGRIFSAEVERLLVARSHKGQPITEFLRELCAATTDITEIRFRTYTYLPGSGLDARIGALIQDEHLASAKLRTRLKRRVTTQGGGLWEALARISAKDGIPVPHKLLGEALVHKHSETERTFVISKGQFVKEGIESILQRLGRTEGLSICSELRVRAGFTMHLPLLDFACDRNDVNRSTVKKMLALVGHAGVLANSGNSYHFIGVSLLTTDEWVRFIGQSLLLSPFIDARFLGHRLVDGECRLRVFASNAKIVTPVIESTIR